MFPDWDDTMYRASTHPFGLTPRFRFPESDASSSAKTVAREASDLSLSDATDLLDWLEGKGLQVVDVELTPGGRMTVRWME